MTLEAIKTYLLQHFKQVHVTEVNGDLFFMYAQNDKQPFATIVTSDNDYDSVSNLSREGFFRLNIGLDKETFNARFGGMTDQKGFEAYLNLDIDFTQEDVLMPHPAYGAMHWACVVNPSEAHFDTLKDSIALSYNKVSKNK